MNTGNTPSNPGPTVQASFKLSSTGFSAEDEKLAHMAMSFELDVEAFLLEPENFAKINFESYHIPAPRAEPGMKELGRHFWGNTKDYLKKKESWAGIGLVALFVVMAVLINPNLEKMKSGISTYFLPPQVTPTPPPKAKPTPTPTPPPTPPPTPTPTPLEPIKLNKPKLDNMKVKLTTQQREQRSVSTATAKLNVSRTSDEAMPDIDASFTTDRANDPNMAVNLENLGAGRAGKGDKDGAPIGAIGGDRRGDHNGTAEVRVNLGKERGGGKTETAGPSGSWVKMTSFGAIAHLQVKCLNRPGTHEYGSIRIQCSNNNIVAAWKRQ